MPIELLERQTDYIHNLVAKEKINEIATAFNEGVVGYQSEGSFTSLATQNPTNVDIPTVVSYGVTKDSDNTHISYNDTTKDFLVNTSGYYIFKSRLRVGREGAAGTSELFFWAEASVDDGATWNILGNSVDLEITNSTDVKLFFDNAELYLPAGIRVRSMYARSSVGNNSGGLRFRNPSASLTTYGVLPAPSAQITIYKAFE